MNEPFFFTKEILDKAIDLHDNQRVLWADVADRLGVIANSLEIAVCRYKAGKMKFKRTELQERRKIMEEMVLQGCNTAKISERIGCERSSVCLTLKKMGYDQETRYEIAPFDTRRRIMTKGSNIL